jgi:cytochrome c oxidase cbb3-type subunit 3
MKNNIINILKSKSRTIAKYMLTTIGVLLSASLFAQQTQANANAEPSVFSNVLFDTLLFVIIFLVIIIIVLSSVLKNVAGSLKDKMKKNGNHVLSITLLIGLLSISNSSFAQDAAKAATAAPTGYGGLETGLFFTMIAFIIIEIIIIAVLIGTIQMFVKPEPKEIPVTAIKEAPSFFEIMNASVAIEKEEEILLDHNYDGIQELDNDLPPWWKYGFYLTIIVGIIYLLHFHVFQTGDLQLAAYNKSMIEAKEAKEAYQKMSANNVTEANVKMLTDAAEIDKGGAIFKDNCAVCHGKEGQGGVGPNLCDDYWLHGGSIVDVFKTIKYGWPDKGMKSWQGDFSPIQINEIAGYVKMFKGHNPPNPKAPQGEKYEEGNAGSSTATNDSTAVTPAKDSVKTEKK